MGDPAWVSNPGQTRDLLAQPIPSVDAYSVLGRQAIILGFLVVSGGFLTWLEDRWKRDDE